MRKKPAPLKARKNISKVLLRRRKSLRRIIGFGIFLGAVYLYGFGDYGFYRYFQLHSDEQDLKQELQRLQSESLQLEQERKLLNKQDPHYLQKIAREKFGLVLPGEKIYKLIPYSQSQKK